MKPLNTCSKCGSDKVGFEFRDWFGDDPNPPREAYGLWFNCLKCGNQWPDKNPVTLWEVS